MDELPEIPVIGDPTTWPLGFACPAFSVLPVSHHTFESDVNEGGFLVTIDGTTLPIVFVGPLDVEPRADGSSLQALRVVGEIGRALDGARGQMGYSSLDELIRDGWRPVQPTDSSGI